MRHETHNVTIRKLGKKGQCMCDLVKKSEGWGDVSSFERGGPLAWGVHWHGAGGGGVVPTTEEGWPKAMRLENACLLCGQNLGYHCHCPPKTVLKFQETGGVVTLLWTTVDLAFEG